MIIGLSKFVLTLVVNGYVFAPICVDACNTVFKNTKVDERAEIVTRGAIAVGGVIASAAVADAVVDLVIKKGAEEGIKGLIRAIV